MLTSPSASLPFGEMLRQWRKLRGVSQMDLALDAEVSARHVSFLETGRARPSREMVLVLASALTVPLRERNGLLFAAGFAPVYAEPELGAAGLEAVQRAIAAILRQHEPFPAVVLNRRWDIVAANTGATRLFGRLVPHLADQPANVLRMILDPDRVRPFVANWSEVAPRLIQRVHQEAVGGVLDPDTRELLDEVLTFLPPELRRAPANTPGVPVIPVHFRRDDLDLRFFSTVTTLGTAADITAQELRMECFFPDDETSERRARELLA